MLCGIQIKFKVKSSYKLCPVKEYGLSKDNRSPKIIASLTTFPARINTVYKTVSTLLCQTVKPDEVILYLAESQFPERKLPKNLTDLEQFGLTIKWCDDIRSYKKLIPALEEYPDDIIITFDDDIYYQEDTVEKLYDSYISHPNEIHSNRCGKLYLKNGVVKDVPMRKVYFENFEKSSYFVRQIGYGAVLYPPKSLHKDVLNREVFTENIPTHDDIWFWAMAVLNKTKIRSVKGYTYSVNYVENTQQAGLCKINKSSGDGGSVENAIKKVIDLYPEIMDNLKEENNG